MRKSAIFILTENFFEKRENAFEMLEAVFFTLNDIVWELSRDPFWWEQFIFIHVVDVVDHVVFDRVTLPHMNGWLKTRDGIWNVLNGLDVGTMSHSCFVFVLERFCFIWPSTMLLATLPNRLGLAFRFLTRIYLRLLLPMNVPLSTHNKKISNKKRMAKSKFSPVSLPKIRLSHLDWCWSEEEKNERGRDKKKKKRRVWIASRVLKRRNR